jgi:hypothetical protein
MTDDAPLFAAQRQAGFKQRIVDEINARAIAARNIEHDAHQTAK